VAIEDAEELDVTFVVKHIFTQIKMRDMGVFLALAPALHAHSTKFNGTVFTIIIIFG
jgi:hypothetical protein